MRIVYVSCFFDTWANPIVYDLAKAVQTLGAELYFIAEKEKISDDRISYIDIERNCLDIKFPSLFERHRYQHPGVERLQKLEHQWQQIEQPNVNFREGYLDQMVSKWFWEAVMSLKIIQPDFGIVFNGQIGRRGAYAEAFKYLKIPFVYAEKGMLPDSWCMDERGVNAEASCFQEKNNYIATDEQIRQFLQKLDEIDRKGSSAWEQPQRKTLSALRSELKIKDGQKVVFFPGQVDSDTNIIKYSPHFKSSGAALSWLLGGLEGGKYFVLVKPHPKGALGPDDYRKILIDKGAVVDLNVLDAIGLSDAIVTINSTVAFEGAIRQKPVLLLGESVLRHQEFVMNYQAGASSGRTLDALLENYQKNEALFHKKALSFGIWLDTSVYCYRRNHEGVLKWLRKFLKNLPLKSEKIFRKEEVVSLLSLPDPLQFVELFNKKILLNILRVKTGRMVKRSFSRE